MTKAQAALEYLTTYGWAILIIAVALAALYSLGVLNPSTFATKASPGQCQIYRPYGVATVQEEELQGLCNEEQPKSVPYFNGGGNISMFGSTLLQANSITIVLWVKINKNSGHASIIGRGALGNAGSFYIGNISTQQLVFGTYGNTGGLATTNLGTNALPTGTWYQLAATYSNSNVVTYINGQVSSTNTGVGLGAANPSNIVIGSGINGGSFLNGYVADVQIYNASLSTNTINLLYIDGIGGDPVQLQNLVGWWPLNGDTIDYSGNGNSGSSNGISFISNWNAGYSAP